MRERQRLQIELRPEEEGLVAEIRRAFGGDSDAEATRRLLAFFRRILAAIASGGTLSVLPADDERAVDFAPELTQAVRPETRYRFLTSTPHPWRRQLVLKGRRVTVGNLIGVMRAERWNADRAAREFDLPVDAVLEVLDYAERNAALLKAEADEERRRALAATHRTTANAAASMSVAPAGRFSIFLPHATTWSPLEMRSVQEYPTFSYSNMRSVSVGRF